MLSGGTADGSGLRVQGLSSVVWGRGERGLLCLQASQQPFNAGSFDFSVGVKFFVRFKGCSRCSVREFEGLGFRALGV